MLITKFRTDMGGLAMEHEVHSDNAAVHMLSLQEVINFLHLKLPEVMNAQGPPTAGSTFSARICGWVYGTTLNGKDPVVYLYNPKNKFYIGPCYKDNFKDLPPQIVLPPRPHYIGSPPERETGFSLGYIQPCEFRAKFERWGQPNKNGYYRCKYVGVADDSHAADEDTNFGYGANAEAGNGGHEENGTGTLDDIRRQMLRNDDKDKHKAFLDRAMAMMNRQEITKEECREFYDQWQTRERELVF